MLVTSGKEGPRGHGKDVVHKTNERVASFVLRQKNLPNIF